MNEEPTFAELDYQHKQRVPDEPALRREVQALVTERNVAQATIDWRFNTQDARIKLHRLYPFDS